MLSEIWPPYEAFYIESMFFDADIALAVLEHVEQIVAEASNAAEVHAMTQRDLLASLQVFVIHAGALSRYFWPSRSTHAWRGAILRGAFTVADSSPLKDRSLRNGLEHFDERLDSFLANNPLGTFLPEYVGPMSEIDTASGHFFRAYYPKEEVFELLGVRYCVMPIAKELARIHRQLMKMRTNGRF